MTLPDISFANRLNPTGATQMSQLNFPNRTLSIMDNLTFLRSISKECIDLIAIDPPAVNETFN